VLSFTDVCRVMCCALFLFDVQIDLAQTTSEGSTALKLQEDKLEATVRELAVKVNELMQYIIC
jgi:hypothetical protein